MKTNLDQPIQAKLNHSDVFLNPTADAITIKAIDHTNPSAPAHGHRCDQWGHPCAGCITSPQGSEQNSAILAKRG